MVTNRNIGSVLGAVRRKAREWEIPVVGHYQRDPFKTLISCLISLRTKDAVTHAASQRLFRLAQTPKSLAALSLPKIEVAIFPAGFYKTKAVTLKRISHDLIERFDGRVPNDLESLLGLKGVGRKTANLVVTVAFHSAGICVDTHVHRISNRWGYVKTRNPSETESALRRRLPQRFWRDYNEWLVSFGQHLCHPTSPWCSRCPVAYACPRRGVKHSR